ncbi:MATE family efflux transporter [Candidatus Micrarchaeota archaeon]|nr:MATE family efflux transporter [Candidatus Micrarchaeota archaeon]
MDEKDLTKGSIPKQLWDLAWPLMLSVFFYTLYNLVDAFWVSKISAEAIAAVSIAQLALFAMVGLGMGAAIGSSVIMAMNIGAKKIKEAERVLGQSFVLAVLIGLFFTIIALVFRNEILTASGATGLVFQPTMEYFIVTAGGSVLFFLLMAIMFAFNSEGDTFTLTKMFALSTLVNVILDPLLIFGGFGIPPMGISGAALATLISQAVFIATALYILSRKNRKIRFHAKNLSFKWASVKEVVNIGIPASLTQVIYPIGMAALIFITSLKFNEIGSIAFSLGFRIEFFAFLPAVGFAFAAIAIMGQSIGSGNKQRAKHAFQKALKYSFIGSTIIGVLSIIFSNFIIGVFTSEPIVTQYANSYILIVGLSYGFLAAAMVEASAFQAIGKSWPGFWIYVIKFIVLSIPLALFLTQEPNSSINGIWIAILVGNVISSVIGYYWITRELNKIDPKHTPIGAVN